MPKSRGNNDSHRRGRRQKRATLTTQAVEQIVREQAVGTTSKWRFGSCIASKTALSSDCHSFEDVLG